MDSNGSADKKINWHELYLLAETEQWKRLAEVASEIDDAEVLKAVVRKMAAELTGEEI